MGLAEREHGLLFATDEQGKRWTLVGNAETVRAMAELAPGEELETVDVAPAKFPMKREGWPDEWADLGSDGAPD